MTRPVGTVAVLILAAIAMAACSASPGPSDDTPDTGADPPVVDATSWTGPWRALETLEAPDYLSTTGPATWSNGQWLVVGTNRHQRPRMLAVDTNGSVSTVATPFDDAQSTSHFDLSSEPSGRLVACHGVFLGEPRVRVYLRSGSAWETLPAITWPGYSFNNRPNHCLLSGGEPVVMTQGPDDTWVFRYAGGTWTPVGGGPIRSASYHSDLVQSNGRLVALTYRLPSQSDPGLKVVEFDGSAWIDARVPTQDPSTEIVFPTLDAATDGAVLLSFMTYGGSRIYRRPAGASTWITDLDHSADPRFRFAATFDRTDSGTYYYADVTHFAQISHTLAGVLRVQGGRTTAYDLDPADASSGVQNVVLNPVDYGTLRIVPAGNRILWFWTEGRSPFTGQLSILEIR